MTTPIDRDAVLDAFASEAVHDRETLERYVRKYPDLAEELIDLASELRMSADLADVEDGPISDPKLNTAWENFLAAAPKAAATTAAVDPFSQFRGVAFASLATKMDVPRSILTAIRDRLVSPGTIPSGFLRRFAEATGSSMDVVKAYIAQLCAAETAEEAISIMRHWAASLPTGGNEVLRPTDEWVRSR